MEEDWADVLADCRRLVDESIVEMERLAADYASEDIVEPVALQQLHDMAEDAAEAGRIRRAETNMAWRRT